MCIRDSFGIGWLAGNYINGMLIEKYTGADEIVNWSPIWIITTICSVVLLIAFALLFKDDIRRAEAEAQTPGPDQEDDLMAAAAVARESDRDE